MKFRVIDGCPVPASIAPYIYLVLRRAGQSASSIYRGESARALLHAHGKHTQAEIHRMMPDISNPPGYSQHELRNGSGNVIPAWHVGVDSGGNDQASKDRVKNAARHYGWSIEHPYSRGVEGHHWCFAHRPRPNKLLHRARIIKLRATLPRR